MIFAGGELPRSIAARAAACGLSPSPEALDALAAHARLVQERNPRLHLTTIVEPAEFVERHLGESFEGIAMLPGAVRGVLLDLGSGNGYPGIPIALLRPGLTPVLAEASKKKAAFLAEALAAAGIAGGAVLARSVQRAPDVAELGPLALVASRAMGGWERVVPKVAKHLAPGGRVLLWAGTELEGILRRAAWRSLRLEALRPLPGRESSTIALLSLQDIKEL